MKTLDNLNQNSQFSEITIGDITICSSNSGSWKLTLPPDTGTAGQFLTTDGSGVTSWTTGSGATVTSVIFN